MKKMNNRGYLIVELILASVLAMTVAYFLLNLVVKMSSKNQDLYVETALLTDKAIMTNLVMEDVNKYTLIRMNNSSENEGKISKVLLRFSYYDASNGNTQEYIDKMVTMNTDTSEFIYGEVICTNSGNEYEPSNCSYKADKTITKKLNSNLYSANTSANTKSNIGNGVNDGILNINSNLKTMYSDDDYGLNLTIPYNKNTLEFSPKIEVKADYKNGYKVQEPNNDTTDIKSLFTYFPSNSSVSCNYAKVKDVRQSVGKSTATCTVTYVFNGNSKTASADVTIEVTAKPAPPKPKYLYYTSNNLSSQGNNTESFTIYRCKDDFTNCSSVAGASGMISSTTTSLSYGLAPVNGSDNFFYSSCRYGNSKTIDVYNVYKSDGTGNPTQIGSAAGYARAYANTSVSSEMVSNSKYMYYSSARYYNSQYSNTFDISACNIDTGKCNDFTSTTVYVYGGNNSANGNGVSFRLGMAANEKYFFYTDATRSSQGNASDSVDIYRCNIDGTDCKVVTGASGWAFTGSGSELYPKLVADDKNLYYTSVTNKYGSTSIYKCNYDGTGCSSIISGAYSFAGAKGQSINVDLDINSKYLYYTTNTGGKGDYGYMSVYKCNRDGTGCESKGGGGSTLLAGSGIGVQVTANDNYVYYTSAGWNRSGTDRINSFSVKRCDIEMSECTGVTGVAGFANPSTGSTIPYKIILTK